MSFAELVASPDLEAITLVEAKVGKELEGNSWNATGGGSWWAIHVDGEIVALKENGVVLTEQVNVAACDGAAGSWFYDHANQRIYVHPTDSDAPDTVVGADYKYTIIGYIWFGFTNSQQVDNPIEFPPQDADNDIYYLPYLNSKSIPKLLQQVDDFFMRGSPTYKGRVSFINDGYWYGVLQNYLWHNAPVAIKIGEKDDVYGDYTTIFIGKIRNPTVGDSEASLEVLDDRVGELTEIPTSRYDTGTYPNLETSAEGVVIPILFGYKTNITPIQINSVTFVYKIAGHALQSIDAVYKNDVALVGGGVDYTADLPNGEFTLTADPGTEIVTCDAKGAKCDYDTGLYTENVADILYYTLNTVLGVAAARIDTPSFDSLKAAKSLRVAEYIDTAMGAMSFIQLLQRTAVFKFTPLLSGKYGVEHYEDTIPAGVPVLRDEDLSDFLLLYQTDGIYYEVVVRYDRDPSTKEWKNVTYQAAKVDYRYRDRSTLVIESALRIEGEAEGLAEYFSQITDTPYKKVEATVGPVVLDRSPTEKLYITKSVTGDDGTEIAVLTDAVYRILSLRKDLRRFKPEIISQDDEQTYGVVHMNIAHNNAHADSHSNVAHDNTAYIDAHSDVFHQNIAHINVAHDNVAHDDSAHSNIAHGDSAHDNTAHFDDAHENTPYLDEAHANEPHIDSHGDSHTDSAHLNDIHANEPYIDSHGDSHSDSAHNNDPHANEPHIDSHGDSHTDSAHLNDVHVNDVHVDSHGNVPHDNTAHNNDPHANEPHHDAPYSDDHDNIAHIDEAHANEPHIDSHGNVPHDNVAHVNEAHDDHTDGIPHENYNDDFYQDHTDEEHEDGPPYGDTAHADTSHTDTYNDSAHEDTVHFDDPHDDYHSNIAHIDSAHENTVHFDDAYQDTSHTDSHFNTPHSNTPHFDDAHGNLAHVNAYYDSAHEDTVHFDDAHENIVHTNVHYNSAYEDTPHFDDGHGNIAHANVHYDGAHEDTVHFDDAHENIAHLNDLHANEGHHDYAHADDIHGNIPHDNSVHDNIAHDNVPHGNSHSDSAYVDDHTDLHTDSHTNISHLNSNY